MKKDIQQKLECIGNIKLNQVSFILKEFLGGSSVVDKDQIDILEGLHLTESSGDDVIIDLRANNGKKSTYVWFICTFSPLIRPFYKIIIYNCGSAI